MPKVPAPSSATAAAARNTDSAASAPGPAAIDAPSAKAEETNALAAALPSKDKAMDRKFDGVFQVEIACAGEPTVFERGFLPAYLGFYRGVGHLRLAGSRTRLSLAVTWNGGTIAP